MRFSAFLAGMMLAACLTPLAHAAGSPRTGLETTDFTLAVHDEQGNIVPVRVHHGWAKIKPEKDRPYALHLTNTTNERIAVIAAIDGRDPFTGRKAIRGQRPHIIDPGKSLVIRHMVKRKQGKYPLTFDPARKVGSIDVISFRENMTYPHTMPWTPHLQKRVGGEVRPGKNRGDLLWLPPSGAPFRKLSPEPHTTIHLEYGTSELMSER